MVRKKRTAGVAGSTRTSVEVLLAEKVQALGEQGDIVRVKPGFARNYLLPQGLATVATEHNKRMVDRHRKRVADLAVAQKKGLKRLADSVSKYSVTLEANANPEGHLYGSIIERDIADAIIAAGFEIPADAVRLEGPLKELGMYTVKLELHPDIETDVKVWVVPAAATG